MSMMGSPFICSGSSTAGGGGGGGFAVAEPRTSDYVANETNKGKIWMRTDETSETVKMVVEFTGSASWTAGTAIGTARSGISGSGASADSALAFGGSTGGSESTISEEWEGVSWSTSDGQLPTAFQIAGAAGTLSATISAGGFDGTTRDDMVTYDGATWTESLAVMVSSRRGAPLLGTTSSALCCAGYSGSVYLATTETYNGATWSDEGQNVAVAHDTAYAGGTGTTSAGLSAGGRSNLGANITNTDEWDGATWSAGGGISARSDGDVRGSQSNAVYIAGITGSGQTDTFLYDGAAWSSSVSINTARYSHCGSGASPSGTMKIFGGFVSGLATTSVEDYAPPASTYSVKTFSFA